MYICKICNVQVPSNYSSFLVTVESRSKTYPFRANANKFKIAGRKKVSHDPGGQGFETVKALRVCESCYKVQIGKT